MTAASRPATTAIAPLGRAVESLERRLGAPPVTPADLESACQLDAILRGVPRLMSAARTGLFPQLVGLFEYDARAGTDLARQLLFVAASIHAAADERRTAEYLLRNRNELTADRRSALSLLLAARCAAEMDVRRLRYLEIPTALPRPVVIESPAEYSRTDDPSVGEIVVDFLSAAVGGFAAAPVTWSGLLDAVAVAVELSERHTLNGGTRPSFVAMRSDARKESRLVTALGAEFGNPTAARGLARLLVGSDRAPVECSLLWWAATRHAAPGAVPVTVKTRWTRDLAIVDRALQREVIHQSAVREFKSTQMGVSTESSQTRYIGYEI